jgi:Uma2 family endonuclease
MATAEITDPDVPDAPGAIVLNSVDWKTYCKLRDDEDNDHVRMSYLDGELILMSPQFRHDFNGRHLLLLVVTVAEALDIEFEAAGATTLRRKGEGKKKGAGKEPDEGFFLGDDAVWMRDKDDLDLEVDPPPTLAIEVDNWGDSKKALATYARLGVPEIWRFRARGRSVWFGRLAGEAYEPIERSAALPRLTRALVLQALEARSARMGTKAWLAWLREWARNLPEPSAA